MWVWLSVSECSCVCGCLWVCECLYELLLHELPWNRHFRIFHEIYKKNYLVFIVKRRISRTLHSHGQEIVNFFFFLFLPKIEHIDNDDAKSCVCSLGTCARCERPMADFSLQWLQNRQIFAVSEWKWNAAELVYLGTRSLSSTSKCISGGNGGVFHIGDVN